MNRNHVNRLTKARERVTSDEVKADLGAQIAVLAEANVKAETFVKENEDKFSLFGWLIKLFN